MLETTVRKRLKRPTFKKGYKQIWSERVLTIEKISVSGVKAELANGETSRLDDLQLVTPPVEDVSKVTTLSAVEKADKSHKTKQTIKHKEGLDPENILSSRLRKR